MSSIWTSHATNTHTWHTRMATHFQHALRCHMNSRIHIRTHTHPYLVVGIFQHTLKFHVSSRTLQTQPADTRKIGPVTRRHEQRQGFNLLEMTGTAPWNLEIDCFICAVCCDLVYFVWGQKQKLILSLEMAGTGRWNLEIDSFGCVLSAIWWVKGGKEGENGIERERGRGAGRESERK